MKVHVGRAACVVLAWMLIGVVTGCAGLQHQLTPGSLKEGSRIHAFQTASFSYAFMASHARQWDATLTKLQSDGLALLRALRKSNTTLDVALREQEKADAAVYDVDLLLASSKAPEPVLVHAEAGMAEEAYEAGARAAAAAIGVEVDVLREGHFAIYATAAMMTALSVSSTSLKKHAFGLLVLKRKIEAGEKADYLSPTRAPEETLEDIEVALRVIAAHHRRMAQWRAEVLGFVALIEAAEADEGLAALEEQLSESQRSTKKWLRDNPQPPTMEQYGVAMNELVLPTPENLLKLLDKDGYLTAAMKIAKSIATGDPRATIEGFAELAPKDSSLRTALDGVAAAANGDIKGTLSALSSLVGDDAEVGQLIARVDRVYSAVGQMKGGIEAIGATIGEPSSLSDLSDRLEGAAEGAQDVREGAGELTQ